MRIHALALYSWDATGACPTTANQVFSPSYILRVLGCSFGCGNVVIDLTAADIQAAQKGEFVHITVFPTDYFSYGIDRNPNSS